jgi:hypothetical protein
MASRRFLHFGGSGGGAAPTLGNVTVLEDGTNWIEFTWPAAHNPATGDVLIAAFGRCTGAGPFAPSAVLGGITAVSRKFLTSPGGINADDALIWIATARDVATGAARSFTLDWGANQAGNTVVFLCDLVGWGGSVGATGGSVYDSTTVADAHAATLVTTGAGRLLVGIAGATNNEVLPITASGWTLVDSDRTGTLGVADNSAAALFRKTGGSIGTTETLSASFDATDNDLGVGLIELL